MDLLVSSLPRAIPSSSEATLSNWFGLTNGKYFGEPPLYVDKQKDPGMTELPKPTLIAWLSKSPYILLTTPNFVWASLSLLLYIYAPYKLGSESTAALGPLTYAFMSERLPIWLSVVLGYFSFWHISLYGFQMASRPFIKDRSYSLTKVIHNVFWTTSGIVIWTGFENVACYLWATDRLPYISNNESFTTLSGGIRFLAAMMLIPLWRSAHFYFAHRFLHYKPLYQQVHSLHHRNTDVEPFSGLCMHPVEHLYYYACIAPSLVFYCSPYTFLWNGVHLLLSPAASHSGYEDHFQSDLFHYLHHRYFECNYAGSDTAFLDVWFGSFKGSFTDTPSQREDAKSNLFLRPTKEFLTYMTGCSLCVIPWGYIALNLKVVSELQAFLSSFLVGFGPVILATLLSVRVPNLDRKSLGSNLIHVSVGTFVSSIPIMYMCWLAIQPISENP